MDRRQFVLVDDLSCFSPEEGPNGIWTMTSAGDLVQVKTKNTGTGKVELHVASRSSNYKEVIIHEETCFDLEEYGNYCVADTADNTWSLFYIKYGDSGKTEVHATRSDSKWKKSSLDTVTAMGTDTSNSHLMHYFPKTTSTWPDLCWIQGDWSESKKVEVHAYQYLGEKHRIHPDPTGGLRVEKGDRIKILLPNDFCSPEITVSWNYPNENEYARQRQYYLVTFYIEDRGRTEGPLFVSKSVSKKLQISQYSRNHIKHITLVVDEDFYFGQSKDCNLRWLILDNDEREHPLQWGYIESLRTSLGAAFWSFAGAFFESLADSVVDGSYQPKELFPSGIGVF